jgi:tripartite-type tricarboxylate transporter receptor subunit TctC
MTLSNRRRLMAIAPALCVLAVAGASSAGAFAPSGYPNKPVKIVVPCPPGGAVDVVTRKMAQKLTEQMGQSFIRGRIAANTAFDKQ